MTVFTSSAALRKILSAFLISGFLLPSFPPEAQAQFNKYRSRSRFAPKTNGTDQGQETTGSASSLQGNENLPANNDEASDLDPDSAALGGQDIFGRGTGIAKTTKGPGSNKYVNLNPETAFGPEVITSFDFPNADILEITKHMQKLTGINLILDKNVKGKISILAPSPITVGDAWKAYLTALNLNGFSIVKSGAFYKIVAAKDIRFTPSKVYTGSYTPEVETYVMRVVPLKYINVKEIDRSFRPFMSRYGRLIPIDQTNTVIIHDTGTNINRLVKLIKFLDVPGHEESLQVVKVKHSSAQEIAKLLQDILQTGAPNARFRAGALNRQGKENNISKIIAEPRTNSIIAMANAEGAKELRSLVAKLDVRQVTQAAGKIHVYYLHHGDAKTMAGTLNKIVSDMSARGGTTRFTSRNAAAGGESLFTTQVKIEPDEANNALVVTASPTDWLTVKSVIAKLDIPREQVYVEGLIMETSIDKRNAFGISVVGAYGSGATQRGAIGNPSGLIQLLSGQINSIGGLFSGFGYGRKVDLTLPDGKKVTVNGINGLITAIAENSNSNVLATPQILTLDNTKGTFEVGETVPIREQNTNPNGTTTVTTTQQKVGLKLEITPHINKVTRFIRMEIAQDISEFAEGDANASGTGARTTTRVVNTSVVVRDRDTIAMGGLMRDRSVDNVTKVPLLGDIPVLGWLFKSKTKRVAKVNLLFFLTPKILASYQKTSAKNLKDVLNRRSVHLKDVQGEDDPFGSTVKGLYKKAELQDQGPLYDKEEVKDLIRTNESVEGIGVEEFPDDEPIELPDYQFITKQLQEKKQQPQTDSNLADGAGSAEGSEEPQEASHEAATDSAPIENTRSSANSVPTPAPLPSTNEGEANSFNEGDTHTTHPVENMGVETDFE